MAARLIDKSRYGQTGTYCRVDNLTHSLLGIVAGDTVARSSKPASGGLTAETRRAFLVTVSVIGGNLPDSDLLVSYSGFTRDKLAYMLQHRGYTHTILGCVILALLLYGAAELVARLRNSRSRDPIGSRCSAWPCSARCRTSVWIR